MASSGSSSASAKHLCRKNTGHRRKHADDRDAVVLQPNRAADDMWIAAKLILPEAIRHDHRVVFQVSILARLIQTAEICMHTEGREKIFRYAGASDELRLALARPGKRESRRYSAMRANDRFWSR